MLTTSQLLSPVFLFLQFLMSLTGVIPFKLQLLYSYFLCYCRSGLYDNASKTTDAW